MIGFVSAIRPRGCSRFPARTGGPSCRSVEVAARCTGSITASSPPARGTAPTTRCPAGCASSTAPIRSAHSAGSTWSLLLPDSAYPEPDSVRFEAGGGEIAFPHRLSPNVDAAVLQIAGFPVMDSLTLAFALRGVERLRLGQGRATDLLVVSLSTTDAVGHAYGPDSRRAA